MEITREQLRERARGKVKKLEYAITQSAFTAIREGLEEELELARIALASLEAEPVAVRARWKDEGSGHGNWKYYDIAHRDSLMADENRECELIYASQPAPASVPDNIDARMKNAGMLSATEIIAGQPIDAFMKHAGVVDLASLLKWAEMRRAEFLRMQAKYVLGDNPKDDMYEWVISHVAAFSELHVNIRAAMLQGAENSESRCTIQTAPALHSSQIIAESPSGNSQVIPDCSCGTCRPVTFTDSRFVVCSECGNKRCPHANDHQNACTGSNEPGQEGSAYPAAPQQEVTQALAKGMERYGDAMNELAKREVKP